jgi:serine phosphatase RsbU (regulator of sigma subunit)
MSGSDLFAGMLARTHLCRPSDVADVLVEELQRALGASGVVIYVVNHEQTTLVPLAAAASPPREPVGIDGTLAGRSFTASDILVAPAGERGRRVLVPVLDGTDRLGVFEAELDVEGEDLPERLVMLLERYGHATAQALVSKRAYGDSLHLAQRTEPMDLGAELLRSVLPPMTFATDGLVISAILEPTYENGGDAFDYAVNDDLAHLAVFDAVGHGLAAARLSTFAVGAYRHSRRSGSDLVQTYAAMDAAAADQFEAESFVTGVLAQLDLDGGVLRWVNAGHPPPLLLRHGQVVKLLTSEPATPFGMPSFGTHPTVVEEQLEPGDVVVLYTDGVTEARRPDGEMFGTDGLTEFLQREAAAQQPPPETLRRLRRSILAEDGASLRDDATLMLVDWQRGTERALLPQTV